jgi:chromosomal replication initiation ATPase DnaA
MGIEWSGSFNAFFRRDVAAASLALTAKTLGVEEGRLAANQRKAPVAFARQIAMYLCHVAADMSLRDVAAEFGRDRTTVSHACHVIEDRRECPIFDRQIEHLEREFRRLIRDMVEASSAPEKKAFGFLLRKAY